MAVFELLRRRGHGGAVALCAFDLLELDGRDIRPEPIDLPVGRIVGFSDARFASPARSIP
jgi:hypothetical protein